MDPDKYQMRDMKRRLTKLEDQIGYLKTDWKRVQVQVNLATKAIEHLVSAISGKD